MAVQLAEVEPTFAICHWYKWRVRFSIPVSLASIYLHSHPKRAKIDAFASRCIIVDSTTRGKSMPDALSKTIPIWCCVLNNLLFPQYSSTAFNSATIVKPEAMSIDVQNHSLVSHPLETPPNIISQTEHFQILAKLPILIQQAHNLKLDLPHLRTVLNGKPLRLRYTTPDRPFTPSSLAQLQDDAKDSQIILCCSASYHTTSPFEGYIQGAGDDSENWAHGLTPRAFWTRKNELMHAADEGDWVLTETIKKIVADEQAALRAMGEGPEEETTKPTKLGKMELYVGPGPATGGVMHGFDVVIVCADARPSDDGIIRNLQQQADPRAKILRLPCGQGKNGSRALRTCLPRLLIPFIESLNLAVSRILVVCDTGGDLSVGVALVLACLYFDDLGYMQSQRKGGINKDFIDRRLIHIVAALHPPAPSHLSRATFQSVKAFLMPGKPE